MTLKHKNILPITLFIQKANPILGLLLKSMGQGETSTSGPRAGGVVMPVNSLSSVFLILFYWGMPFFIF